MARDDDTIEPRLGRIRSRGSAKRGQRYLQTVLRSIAKAGGPARGDGPRSKFQGSRIGRAAPVSGACCPDAIVTRRFGRVVSSSKRAS